MKTLQRVYPFNGQGEAMMADIADCLDASPALRTQAVSAVRRWQQAAAPRIFRADDKIGFDYAMALPFLPEKDPSIPTWQRKTYRRHLDHSSPMDAGGALRSQAKALIRLRPSGEVLSCDLPCIPLEDSGYAMVRAIAKLARSNSRAGWQSASAADLRSWRTAIVPDHIAEIVHRMLTMAMHGKDIMDLRFPRKIRLWDDGPDESAGTDAGLHRLMGVIGINGSRPHSSFEITGMAKSDCSALAATGLPRGVPLTVNCRNMNADRMSAFFVSLVEHAMDASREEAIDLAFSYFRSRLNRRLLASSSGHRHPGKVYNWLLARGDLKASAVRYQALDAYPALVGEVASRNIPEQRRSYIAPPPTPPLAEVETAIGNEERLEPALAIGFGLPPVAIRAMRWVSLPEISAGMELHSKLEKLSAMKASELPSGHWPDIGSNVPIGQQWRAMLLVADIIRGLKDRDSQCHLINVSAADALKAEPPSWRTTAGILRVMPPLDGSVVSSTWITDMASLFATQVLFPLAIDALQASGGDLRWNILQAMVQKVISPQAPPIAVALGRNRSIAKLIDMSNHWHKKEAWIEAAIVKATDDRDWRPLFASRPAASLVAVALKSAGELADEGSAQDHCVATYVASCLYERTHIVSIRTVAGDRVSTVHLSLGAPEGDHPPRVRIVQNMGRGNSEPSQEALAAANALLEDILSGAAVIDWQGIESARAERSADRPDAVSETAQHIGYDPTDQVGRDAALAAWSFALPKDERGLSDLPHPPKSTIEHDSRG